jgi:hypothetical protein
MKRNLLPRQRERKAQPPCREMGLEDCLYHDCHLYTVGEGCTWSGGPKAPTTPGVGTDL